MVRLISQQKILYIYIKFVDKLSLAIDEYFLEKNKNKKDINLLDIEISYKKYDYEILSEYVTL